MNEAARMALEVQARPESVRLARLAVATFCADAGFTLSDIEEIKVAVSEAVTNAIVHGYGQRQEQVVRIEACLTGDGLEISVTDWGRGIADLAAARRLGGGGEHTGLGFIFMESLMDSLQVETAAGAGTRVVMRRCVRPPAA